MNKVNEMTKEYKFNKNIYPNLEQALKSRAQNKQKTSSFFKNLYSVKNSKAYRIYERDVIIEHYPLAADAGIIGHTDIKKGKWIKYIENN